MQIIKFLLALVIISLTLNAQAQIDPKNKLSTHFVFSGLHMTLSNNFIISPAYKYTPNDLSLPFKDEYFDVYGSELLLSAFSYDSFKQLPAHHGSFFFDTLQQDKPMFELSALGAKYTKNGVLIRDWTMVSSMRSFTDSGKSSDKKIIFMHPYSIIADSLDLGDSVLIELRHVTEPPFLRLHAKRKNAYTRPHMNLYMQDSSNTEQEFIQKQISGMEERRSENLFYADWPRGGLSVNNQQFDAKTKLAFMFRSDPLRDDSTLLFRLITSYKNDTSWKKSNGVIVLTTLRENTRYKLEVKFANGLGTTSVYTFHTPAKWYQTTAFKIASVLAGFAMLIIIILIIRAQRRKTTRKLHDLEVQSLYAQMNPHFLFNALGSIQGLMNDNRIEQANLYLTEFAALLRASISQGKKELVPITTDIKNIDRYIELERLRFNFKYDRNIDSKLATSDIEIPSMLAQPLIENAVKHAISALGEAGSLGYSVQQENTDIIITVSDNGHGFDSQEMFSGQGLRLTRERIRLFNRMHNGRGIELEFKSSNGGTKAFIRLQKWLA